MSFASSYASRLLCLAVAAMMALSRAGPALAIENPRSWRIAPLLPALARGRAQAFFSVDAGADQLTDGAIPRRRLLVEIRIGGERLTRIVAYCAAAELGSALGGGTQRELEAAMCDGEYWLISEPGEVTVRKGDISAAQEIVLRYELPDKSMRATSMRPDAQ